MATEKTGSADPGDDELIAMFRAGRAEGFNMLVRRYQQKVYWIARRIVPSHEDADDVVQDVFIRVHDGLKDFRAESGFYTWVYRITVNVALNAVRARKVKKLIRLDDLTDQPFDQNESPVDRLEQTEYQAALRKAIDKLPAKQKLVFTMRYQDELSYEEIARILNKSVGGLKANYFHALKKIQDSVRRDIQK
ncbi:MAG TPA: sigma-70 family RNA polymerase sigma factor [Bacteroidota bacterium]|nr:sigma-70 family RNA polymerase sigma factor [Bacteroidota bacterium]